MTCEEYLKLNDDEKNEFIYRNIFGFECACGKCPGCMPDYQNWEGFGKIVDTIYRSYQIHINASRFGSSRKKGEHYYHISIHKGNTSKFEGEGLNAWDALVCAWIKMQEGK